MMLSNRKFSDEAKGILASALCLVLLWIPLASCSEGTKIFGLMVTRSDYWVMHTWLAVHAWQFEKLVILDGTTDADYSSRVESQAKLYENVVYANERKLSVPMPVTDNTLRGLAWSLMPNASEALGHWIVVAHPDEFYLQRFSDLANQAEAQGANALSMNILYALPYANDRLHLEDGVQAAYQDFNILYRVRYCLSDYSFLENRMYKYESQDILWGNRHALTRPEHFPAMREANFTGWYVHYKLHNFDVGAVTSNGKVAHSTWSHIGSSADIYESLDDVHAKLCSTMVGELCRSVEPPCRMQIV